MGQYWGKGEEKEGGIVKTATVKTIYDGSAQREQLPTTPVKE